jgi:hypothetical protein
MTIKTIAAAASVSQPGEFTATGIQKAFFYASFSHQQSHKERLLK